mmetsp:Transcript_20088/g.34580  ORF Transcript_20088/g.34580 Transcript_20088/m.34580 type:complete len:86 (+) Transcript_20088:317-574(+)
MLRLQEQRIRPLTTLLAFSFPRMHFSCVDPGFLNAVPLFFFCHMVISVLVLAFFCGDTTWNASEQHRHEMATVRQQQKTIWHHTK